MTGISGYENTTNYSYDALNQVKTESTYLGVGGPQDNNLYTQRTYAYDHNGNRTSEQRTDVLPNLAGTAAVTRSYAAATAADCLVSYAQSSTTPALQYSAGFTHDARGNRLAQSSSLPSTHPSISYGHDHFSRMIGCTNGTTSVVYAYDALGRKVKRLKRDATIYPDSTYYVYDGLDPVCTVRFNPASTECTTVTWLLRGLGVARGIGNIVAQQRYTIHFGGATSQPVTHYYHPNHRGDTAYLTDASGVKAASYVYDAFGCLLTDNGSPITDHRFSSKEWDADAQLYYFGFRWYDPDSGTWTTKDPLGFAASDHNLYRVVFNQPLSFVDSYGLRLRLMYDGFIHSHLRVDTYDKQGKRTGTAELHFVPKGENGSSYKVVDLPTPFTTNTIELGSIELGSIDTTLEQDRAIYDFLATAD